MRLPEAEELKRLQSLYGTIEGQRRMEERKEERAFTDPLFAANVSWRNVAKLLAARRCPDLYQRKFR